MTDPAFIISFAVLFVFSVYLGFSVGNALGARAVTEREYWRWNIIAIVACVLATAVLTTLPLLYAVPLGLLAGAIVGLKMGFGESVGPWAFIDRFFNINRAHRETAERGTGEARRRRRRTGEAAPDVISVDMHGQAGGQAKASEDAARTRPASRRKKR